MQCVQAKDVEKTAIEEGIRENGAEDGDKVVQAVLAARHAQVSDLFMLTSFHAHKLVLFCFVVTVMWCARLELGK